MPQFNEYNPGAALLGTEILLMEQDGVTLKTSPDELQTFVSYTLPTASISVLGGVKSGTDITVDGVGNVSVTNSSHLHAWSNILNTPTTIAGYGIVDAVPFGHQHAWADITTRPTTLVGYGITDAAPITHVGGDIHIDWSVTGVEDIHADRYIAGSGGALTDLSDVKDTFVGLTDGQILTYDTTNGWQNETPGGGSGTVTSVTAGAGMTQTGTSTINPTLNVIGGTGITANADEILLNYIGTDNFINSATNLEGTAIAATDTIIYHDADDSIIKKGLVSDLPTSGGVSDHTLLSNIGTNTHAQIDTHIGLANEHIDWTTGTQAGFDSLGIDDGALSTVLSLSDSAVTLGTFSGGTNIFNLERFNPSGALRLLGGGFSGALITLYGQTHVTKPKDFEFSSDSVVVLYFDESASEWDFKFNDIITTGDVIGTNITTHFGLVNEHLDWTQAVGTIHTANYTDTIYSHPSTHPWSMITSTPTTLAGYVISDNKASFDTALSDGAFSYEGHIHSSFNTYPILFGPTVFSTIRVIDGIITDIQSRDMTLADLGFTGATDATNITDHTLFSNIGTNTHSQIDTHLALANEHIDWTTGLGVGFKSKGIDDNGTRNVVTVEDWYTSFGDNDFAEQYHIGLRNSGGDSSISFGVGLTDNSDGSAIKFFANTHSLFANDIVFYAGIAGVAELRYDHSISRWDFIDNDIKTAGNFYSAGMADNTISKLSFDLRDDYVYFGDLNGSAFHIGRNSDVGDPLTIGPDNTTTKGAVIKLYSSGDASTPDDFAILASNVLQLFYDDSASIWNFQSNDIVTTGEIINGNGFTGPHLKRDSTASSTSIYGGTGALDGSYIRVYGSTYSGNAYDIYMFGNAGGGDTAAHYDYGAN
jgi:hypothetical protein